MKYEGANVRLVLLLILSVAKNINGVWAKPGAC